MFDPLFIGCVLMSILLIGFSIFMINFGGKKGNNGKINMPVIIVGWVLLVLTVIASIVGLILYISESGGYFGTILFTIISPIFIIIGVVVILIIGISSLMEGYRKNQEGQRDKSTIIRGWSMLALSILTLTAIIVTLVILFINYSNSRGDTPVRFM